MSNTVIETIKRLEANESPSKSDQELLDYLQLRWTKRST